MKRHYELVYSKKGLESLEEFSPELFEEYKANIKIENNNTSEDIYIDEGEEIYNISFSTQSRIEPDYYYTALKYFREGKDFSFLIWQDFYQFISEWLIFEGFCVRMPSRENGFINIETTLEVDKLGFIKCVWLLKKFSTKRIVGIKYLRELEYLVNKSDASKGIIVTTSSLSKSAVKFIENNKARYEYIDGCSLDNIFQRFREPLNFQSDIPF